MKDSIAFKNSLMVVSIVLLMFLFLNGNLFKKEEELVNPYSKVGIVEIYNNRNVLLGKFDTFSIIDFVKQLNLKKMEISTEQKRDVPFYTIQIYNKELRSLDKYPYAVASIDVYDDYIYVNVFGLTYKANSNLKDKLLDRYNLVDLKLPQSEPKYGNAHIVELAGQQLGNVGGEKFWSWYEIHNNLGFYRRMEWCCVFVSWLRYQTGYLQAGEIPMFPNVSKGVAFYKNRGKWQGKHYVPSPGDVIFFDLMLSDRAYHVGMVEKVANGRVYTIEGNYNDMVARRSYPIGSPYIYGYGTPDYKIKKPIYLK